MKVNRRIINQIIREFWIQTLIAIGWGIYQACNKETKEIWILVFIKNFGAALFLLSWFIGQYVRIKKTKNVEDSFSSVKEDLQGLIDKLEQQTEDIIGYSTGGNSVATLRPMIRKKDHISFYLRNALAYPVFDVNGYWINLDEEIDPDNGRFWTEHHFPLQNLYPNRMIADCLQFDVAPDQLLRLNISLSFRNGNISHEFRVANFDGKMQIAFTTIYNGEKTYNIPDGFPGYDPQNQNALFQ